MQAVSEEKKRRRSIDQGLMGMMLKQKGLDKATLKVKKKLSNMRDAKAGGGGIFAKFSKKFSKRVSTKHSVKLSAHSATAPDAVGEEDTLLEVGEQKS